MSQVNVANMYKTGMGVAADAKLALHYYGLAKDRNEHAKAMWESMQPCAQPGLAAPTTAPTTAASATSAAEAAPKASWRDKLSHWWND